MRSPARVRRTGWRLPLARGEYRVVHRSVVAAEGLSISEMLKIGRTASQLGGVALLSALAPAVALAHPHHGHRAKASAAARRLTIGLLPNPLVAGDPLLIFGRLSGPGAAGRTVTLWRELAGATRFSMVGQTATGPGGYYAITRADGVVTTDRAFYVRVDAARSRTAHPRVAARVVLTEPAQAATAGQPVVLTGRVIPADVGQGVVLQRQVGRNGDDWRTLTAATVGAGGTFMLTTSFAAAQPVTLRALVGADADTLRGVSSPVGLIVQQSQSAGLTLAPSADPLDAGQPLMLSGMLASPPPGGGIVTLLGRTAGGDFSPLGQTRTDADGNFSFRQLPVADTVYRVARAGGERSADVVVGVRDVVTLTAAQPRAALGQTVALSGTVAPDHSGHTVDLQLLGDDGGYHTVTQTRVSPGSLFSFRLQLTDPGAKTYRALLAGGPENETGVSPSVSVAVIPAAAASFAGGGAP